MTALDPFIQGRKIAPPASLELRGPADPDNFRVKVGRFNERWYHDPLPACDIAPAWTDTVPSVSTVKKASGSDWSFVALKRVATAVDTPQYARLDLMPYEHRYEALKAINKLGLSSAARRGTNVHLMAEAHLYGQPCPVKEGEPGYEYRGAVDQFFDQYQPELVAAEFVCINRALNGTGYGGTADAIIKIDGEPYLVDWKSRGADSDHGAYPEEAAQIAAYAMADYIIVEGENGPERRRVPELSMGLIVSIKPDGCRVYPINFIDGCAHWDAMHAWWVARRDERKAVGRQWVPRKLAEGSGSSRTPSPAEVNAMDALQMDGIRTAQSALAARPSAPTPQLEVHRDEGTDQHLDEAFNALEADYARLGPDARTWIKQLTEQAAQAGVSFHAKGHRTERRWWLIKALVALGHADMAEDDVLRALMALSLASDAPLFPSIKPGYALGAHGAAEARSLHGHVVELVADRLVVHLTDDGVLVLRPQAA